MKHIHITYIPSIYKVAEWVVFRDTKQRIIGTWEEA
jgi:hypothetical protein